MTQADTHINTRRAFLSTAAGVAAAVVAAPAALASSQADPTFARIEAYRAADGAHSAACAEQARREQVLIDEGIGTRPFAMMIISGGSPVAVYNHPYIDAYWGCASEQVRAKAHADLDCVSARHHEIMGNSDQEAGQRGFVASDAFDELIGGVPTTARGLRAMVSYLAADPNAGDVFRLDDNRIDMLLVSIDEALQALHPAAA